MLGLSQLAQPERTIGRDRGLGAMLAFVAGATNAGGFLAVGQYTSHMTGIVSTMADAVVLGRGALALSALAALGAFVTGAMTTAICVNWARRHQHRSLFAFPILLEATLLLAFGFMGATLSARTAMFLPLTVLTLCFLMGLQNAVITKVSHAVIRTTHVTGLVTDIGIELGRLIYVNRTAGPPRVVANRKRLAVHLLLLSAFIGGSLTGALGFKTLGYIATLPLAGLLLAIAWRPIVQDLRRWMRVAQPETPPAPK